MFRALGFLSGVCLTVAVLLLVLEPADLQRLRAGTACALAQILPQPGDSADSGTQQPFPALPVDQSSSPVVDSVPQQMPSKSPGDQSQTAAGEGTAVTPGPATPSRKPATAVADPPPVAPEERSGDVRNHLFWNAFLSEVAAQGFAGRLSSTTNVPVVVVKAGPANYRVGFGYRDEAERRALIERIESVTGLELK